MHELQNIATQIYAKFAFETTFGQKKIIEKLAEWLETPQNDQIFILNGYAGTGKTTLIGALVGVLRDNSCRCVLLAPTGRAAKVLAQYTGERTYTIHKKIYRQQSSASIESKFSLDYNRERDAVFIVDEASMLANGSSYEDSLFGSGALLEDLIKYVQSGRNCRLILVGDNAQLPPIGNDYSPALDPVYMSTFGTVDYGSLDDVVRQDINSGILFNATLVRTMLENHIYEIPLLDMNYPDVEQLSGADFMERIEECYSKYGRDETIVITRSNRRANRYNEALRRTVLFAEEEIESGDMLMVVKNNYFYASDSDDEESKDGRSMNFIANGDIARLRRLRRIEELYGFRFANAVLEFDDYDSTEIECKILLDTVASESPSLTRDESLRLFRAIEEDYPEIRSKAKRYKEIRENPYFNAVQVKFAYAVTCHKSQGGQWSAVFIDKMLFGDEQMSKDLLRWLYTAMTRATEKLYFVNFDERFFDK